MRDDGVDWDDWDDGGMERGKDGEMKLFQIELKRRNGEVESGKIFPTTMQIPIGSYPEGVKC